MTQLEERIAVGPAVPPSRAGRRRASITGVVIVALLMAAGVGVAALIRASFGDRMASAAAMPADTQIYINVDFGAFDDLDRLLGAFDAAFAEAGMEASLDAIIAEIDPELEAQLGFTIDEITPWAGRDFGIGVFGLDLSSLGDPAGTAVPAPDIVVALAVRDTAGADAFIEGMVDGFETRDEVMFGESSYKEVSLVVGTTPEGLRPTFGRSGDLMLLASSPDAIRRAIDAQEGTSLADDATMDETFDLLSANRAATIYLSGDVLEGFASLPASMLAPAGEVQSESTLRSLAVSLALTDDGVRLDMAQLFTEDAAAAGSVDDLVGSSELPQRFGEDTFAFFGADFAEPASFDLDEILEQSGLPDQQLFEIRGALSEFEGASGIDIQTDVIDLLGTSLGFGIADTGEPIGDFPAGITVQLGTTDPVAMRGTLDRLADFVRSLGAVVTEPEGTAHVVDLGDGQEISFGIAGDFLVMSTGGELDWAAEDERNLTDNAFFAEATAALGSDRPVMFLDLTTALRVFDAPPEVVRNLEPVRGVIAGGEGVTNGSRFTVLTLIDY